MPPRAARGVTLIELLVAMLVTAVVLVGVVATVRAQQQAYVDGHRVREAQASGRDALLYLEQKLPLAGYGMAPSLALDLDRYTTGPCPAELAVGGSCARDRIDDSDELVFHARNPSYWIPPSGVGSPAGRAWNVTTAGITGTLLNLDARAGDEFRRGQILQAVCDGASQYVYVTVKTTALPAVAGALALELEDAVSTDPFRRQDAATDPCFSTGQARVFAIDRYRLHVRPVAVDGNTEPYLMLDRGTDAPEEFVAGGIESLQVAYVLADGRVVGATPGAGIALAAGFPGATDTADALTTLAFPGPAPDPDESVYSPTSWYRYVVGPPADPERLTDHQANVRAIRLAVVARSATPDPTQLGTAPMLTLNQSGVAAWAGAAGVRDGYQRVVFEATIPLPNMLTQGMVYF